MGVLDITVLVTMLINGLHGFKKGFIRGVVGLISILIAFVLAYAMSSMTAEYLYEKFEIENYLEANVTLSINNAVANVTSSGNEYTAALNKGFDNLVNKMSLFSPYLSKLREQSDVKNALQNSVMSTKDNVISVICNACKKPIIKVLTFFSFVGIFLIVRIVCGALLIGVGHLLESVPVLMQINSVLGFVVGVIKGFGYGLVVIGVLYFILTMQGVNSDVLSSSKFLELLGFI